MYTESLLFSQSQQLEEACTSPIFTCIDAVLIANQTEVSVKREDELQRLKELQNHAWNLLCGGLTELSKLCYLAVVITAYDYHDMDVVIEWLIFHQTLLQSLCILLQSSFSLPKQTRIACFQFFITQIHSLSSLASITWPLKWCAFVDSPNPFVNDILTVHVVIEKQRLSIDIMTSSLPLPITLQSLRLLDSTTQQVLTDNSFEVRLSFQVHDRII